jgi:AcrR family transcriptional regulator
VFIIVNVKVARGYTMRARAESTARTRERILDAVIALSEERLTVEIVLADVAERAGVSVQTVLRHFGSKEKLFDEVVPYWVAQVRTERTTPVGDAATAVDNVVRFYDRLGNWTLRMQALEHSDESSRRAVAVGRRFHRRWVEEAFAPQLAGRLDRDEVVDLLVVATDVLTWKILRRDQAMNRKTTCQRMLRLVECVLSASPEGG